LRFEKGDFSSTIYPFDTQDPIYLCEKLDVKRQSISAKYGFYLLAKPSHEVLEEYPLFEPLVSRNDDQAFLDRLLQGLKLLFARLRRRVGQVCELHKLTVGTIGLSIPSQWTLEFEDFYRTLVSEVFQFPQHDIYFVYEAEALAHFLCKNHMDFLIPCRNVAQNDVLLFLDFGGHNMVCPPDLLRGFVTYKRIRIPVHSMSSMAMTTSPVSTWEIGPKVAAYPLFYHNSALTTLL
jgi:hypothetical protein